MEQMLSQRLGKLCKGIIEMDGTANGIFLEAPKIPDRVEDSFVMYIPGLYLLEILVDGRIYMSPAIDYEFSLYLREILSDVKRNLVRYENQWEKLVVIETGPMWEYTYTYDNKAAHWSCEVREGYA